MYIIVPCSSLWTFFTWNVLASHVVPKSHVPVAQTQRAIAAQDAKRAKQEERRRRIKQKVKLRRGEGWNWASNKTAPVADSATGALEIAIAEQLRRSQEPQPPEDPLLLSCMGLAGMLQALPMHEARKLIASFFTQISGR